MIWPRIDARGQHARMLDDEMAMAEWLAYWADGSNAKEPSASTEALAWTYATGEVMWLRDFE